jgi:hypothetical protein
LQYCVEDPLEVEEEQEEETGQIEATTTNQIF